MSTLTTKLDKLEALAKHKRAPVSDVERIRQYLESVDGQANLDRRPGERLYPELRRRVQIADGWNLALMPGDTLEEKEQAVDAVLGGTLTVSDEARFAARYWFELWGKLY